MGRNEPAFAEKSAYSALKLALAYSFAFAALFFSVPELFLHLFSPEHHGATALPEVVRTGTILLRMVAVYTVFDTMVIVLSGALKGAGDTRFAMAAQTVLAWLVLVVPVYVTIEYLRMSVFTAWACLVCYSLLAGTVFLLRFRSGYWKTIRIVERRPEAEG
jgi:MATE family multidrug resistance protein